MSGAAATDAGGIKTTSGEKTYTMTVSAKYQGANLVLYLKTAPFLTFVQGTQVTIEQNIDGQIDVRDPSFSKYFVTDTTHNPAGIKSALYLGGMKYTTAGNDIRLKDGNTFKPTNMLKTAQIVLEGLPLVAAVEGNDATGYVTLNSGHCTASKDFGTKTLIDSSGKVTLDVEADNASGLGICLWTNGETNLQKGQVTIEVSAKTSATDMTANMSHALKHLTTVTKNGTSLKILNIPDRDTTGDKPSVRLYNKGESEATIIGTMYDQDGNVIGTKDSDLLAGEKIGPKEVRILGFATIASALGVSDTGWPNQRAWMQIESDSLSLDAQGLVRTGDVLVNMSGGAEVE
jgi:hypothetical protein